MKKEIKTELTREKIMTAAMNEFGSKGYAASSLNNICGTGISKGLLYHNFKNKDALYLSCVDRCFKKLTSYFKDKKDLDLRKYMDIRLKFLKENVREARIFFETILQPPLKLKDEIKDIKCEFDSLNKTIYENMISGMSLREGVSQKDAMEYFTLIQSMFNGYFSSPVYCQMNFSDVIAAHENMLYKILEYMIYGIAKRGEDK